jgi:hypothetical protein
VLPVVHWDFIVQLFGQPDVWHTYGVQSIVVPVGHIPPVQSSWGWRVLPTHAAIAHTVPLKTCSQLPLPSQLPSLPHVAAGHWPFGAGLPCWIGAHWPLLWPVRALEHAVQVPVQVVSQQKPLRQ